MRQVRQSTIGKALSPNRYGWTIVAMSFVAIALVYAVRASIGLMMPIWEDEPGWTRTFVSSSAALVLALMAIGGPLAGNMLDRYGPRIVYTLGLLAVGAAVLITSRIAAEWQFLIYFGVLGGIGAGILSMPMASATAALYFERHRGLAAGIAGAGASGGQLIAMPVLGLLVTLMSWRSTYLILAIAILYLVPLVLLLMRRGPPTTASKHQREGSSRPHESLSNRLLFLLRSRTFLLLFGAFSLCGFTTAGVIDTHLIPYAAACGYPPLESATAYGVLAAFNGLGLILFGHLADRTNPVTLLAGMFFVRALTFVLLLYISNDLTLLFVFAVIFGLFNFATLPVVTTIVANRIGVHILGLSVGLLFGGHSAGAAVGAFMGGWLYGLFARYVWLWDISLALAVLAGVLTLCIRGPIVAPPRPAAASP